MRSITFSHLIRRWQVDGEREREETSSTDRWTTYQQALLRDTPSDRTVMCGETEGKKHRHRVNHLSDDRFCFRRRFITSPFSLLFLPETHVTGCTWSCHDVITPLQSHLSHRAETVLHSRRVSFDCWLPNDIPKQRSSMFVAICLECYLPGKDICCQEWRFHFNRPSWKQCERAFVPSENAEIDFFSSVTHTSVRHLSSWRRSCWPDVFGGALVREIQSVVLRRIMSHVSVLLRTEWTRLSESYLEFPENWLRSPWQRPLFRCQLHRCVARVYKAIYK